MLAHDFLPLIHDETLERDAILSAPTPDHYLPLLYILGTWREQETVRAFDTAYYRELVTVVPEVTDGFIRPLEG